MGKALILSVKRKISSEKRGVSRGWQDEPPSIEAVTPEKRSS